MRRLMGLLVLVIVAVAAGTVLSASTPAAAAEFPIKGRAITILSPYTAGGSTDLVFVSSGKFLAGGGGLFTHFTFVAGRGGDSMGFA